MTFIVASLTVGGALLYSAFKNQSFLSVLLGAPPEPDQAQGSTAAAAGLLQSLLGGKGGTQASNVIGGSDQVKGHPELKPGISRVVNQILAQFPQLHITSTTNHSRMTASGNVSLHVLGRAADLVGTPGMMNQAAQWIQQNLANELTEGIHNPGLSVKDKKVVPSSFWGTVVWTEHLTHIHVGV